MSCHNDEPRENFGNNLLPGDLSHDTSDLPPLSDSHLHEINGRLTEITQATTAIQVGSGIAGLAGIVSGPIAAYGLLAAGVIGGIASYSSTEIGLELGGRDPNNPDVNQNGDPDDDVDPPSPNVGSPGEDLPNNSPFHCQPVSPLVIDLDGDGIELTSLQESQTHFDLNVDGFAERTGWVQSDDGLLALDVNGNGTIDDNSELFGNATGFDNGFLQLAELDSNSDGVIDENDVQFSELSVWRDFDQDGVSDDGELQSLTEAGISSIDLNAVEVNETNQEHLVSDRSTVSFSDGTSGIIEDIHFQNDPRDSITLLPDGFEYSDEALVMPFLFGYGQISSTWVSLSQDEELRNQVSNLLGHLENGDIGSFKTGFDSFILDWAGVSEIDPDSRGQNIDARHLEFLEKAYGTDFIDQSNNSNPEVNAGRALEAFYDELTSKLAGRFAAQSAASSAILSSSSLEELTANFNSHPLASLTPLALNSTASSPSLDGNLSEVLSGLQQAIATGTISATNAAAIVYLLKADFSVNHDDLDDLIQTALTDSGIDPASELATNLQYFGNDVVAWGTDSADNLRLFEAGSLIGNGGDDTLTGSGDADTYVYSFGDGNDVISDQSGFANVNDRLKFTDVNADDVTFSQNSGQDLVITLSNGETITIKDHFQDSQWDLEQIEFADGTVLDVQAIRDKSVADQKASGSVQGSSSAENYSHSLGDGSYTITDWSGFTHIIDTLTFTDVNSDEVSFSQNSGRDLVITLSNGETITITDHFQDSQWDLELIEFADGTVLDAQAIRDKSVADQKASGSVQGSSSAENYSHTLGDGSYTISDQSGFANVTDTLTFTDVNLDSVTFASNADKDLIIALSNGETITIKDQFQDWQWGLEQIEFADGTVLDTHGINELGLATGPGDDNLIGTSLHESLSGGAGNDTIDGGYGNDNHYGGDGDDLIKGNSGADFFDGGNGIDTIDFSYSSDNFTIDLSQAVAVSSGGHVEQALNFENVVGGSGSNTLIGSDVQNVLNGGTGNDTLTGGDEADEFVFTSNFGDDTVTDFADGVDMIRVDIAGVEFGDLVISQNGTDAEVDVAGHGKITLEDVDSNLLTVDDFLI